MTVQDFLNALGGTSQVSRALGVPLTTVATWGQKNKLPKWRMPALASLAIQKGHSVPASFSMHTDKEAV